MSNITRLMSLLSRPRSIETSDSCAPGDRFNVDPGTDHNSTPSLITIRASDLNGFEIYVWSDENGIRVCFGGLEQEFETPESAFLWVRRAMSPDCRLRIDYSNKRPYRWVLDYLTPDDVRHDQLSFGHGAGRSPFQKRWSEYRQNTAVAADDEFTFLALGPDQNFGSPAACFEVRPAFVVSATSALEAESRTSIKN